MSDTFGLVYRRQVLMDSATYLRRESVGRTLIWGKIGDVDCITQQVNGSNDSKDASAMLTLVGIGATGDWYNKLSGLGDHRPQHPRPLSKLKWLIHFKPPVNTIFMEDWETGIATLRQLQEQISVGEPNDLLVFKEKGSTDIRTTKNMFAPKVSVHSCTSACLTVK